VQRPDGESANFSGELGGGENRRVHWLVGETAVRSLRHPLWRPADTPRVEKVVEQQIARPFHEERPRSGRTFRSPQVDHRRVGLDLTESPDSRAAQRQARRHLILDVQPHRGAGIGED
jgi:hypothetical protein